MTGEKSILKFSYLSGQAGEKESKRNRPYLAQKAFKVLSNGGTVKKKPAG